mmetsp:Transcript_35986/g.85348  ORF Transcript_35986/g.85348 Transcript_35986/m.85348 type:complete len:93 (+) Transcript_35986:1401-1679(+)
MEQNKLSLGPCQVKLSRPESGVLDVGSRAYAAHFEATWESCEGLQCVVAVESAADICEAHVSPDCLRSNSYPASPARVDDHRHIAQQILTDI